MASMTTLYNEETMMAYVNEIKLDEEDFAFAFRHDEARVLPSIVKLAEDGEYRCLAIAAKKFQQKLENGLAALYGHADKPDSNHLQVLLNRKGGAFVKTSNANHVAPTFCNRAGIHFNEQLLGASMYFESESEEEILNDIHGAAYVAILELAITHEFGRMKLHHDLEDSPEEWEKTINLSNLISQGQLMTADEYPLYREAGFSIEARIGDHYFNEKDPNELGRRRAEKRTPIHLLVAITKPSKKKNPFVRLKVQRVLYKPNRETPYQCTPGTERENGMSLEEIQNFMSYGLPDIDSSDDATGGRNQGGSDSSAGGRGSHGDNDDGDSGGSDNDDGDDGDDNHDGGGGRKRKRSETGKKPQKTISAWARATGKKLDFKMPKEDDILEMPKDFNPNFKVSLRLCDENGLNKTSFLPTEDMCVEVTVKNDSTKNRHMKHKGGNFAFSGRSGHVITIKECKEFYTPSESPYDYKTVTIGPKEKLSFKPTTFAIGLHQKQRDWCGTRTPLKEGNYEAEFYFRGSEEKCLGSAAFNIKKFDLPKSGLKRHPLMGYYYFPKK